MGLIDSIINSTSMATEYFPPTENPEHPRKHIREAYSFAKNKLKIVTGEADPDFYNDRRTLGVFRTLMNNQVKINLVFHKLVDYEEALSRFKRENDGIYEMLSDFSQFMYVYWIPFRPSAHYSVIDDEHMVIEDPHPCGVEREVVIKFKDKNAPEWEKRFDTFLNHKAVKRLSNVSK